MRMLEDTKALLAKKSLAILMQELQFQYMKRAAKNVISAHSYPIKRPWRANFQHWKEVTLARKLKTLSQEIKSSTEEGFRWSMAISCQEICGYILEESRSLGHPLSATTTCSAAQL